MSIAHEKLLEIFRQELKNISPQYDGYIETLEKELVEIFNLEVGHLVKNTNIQQQINQKCEALGMILCEHGNKDGV